jgi:hypothetical protein
MMGPVSDSPPPAVQPFYATRRPNEPIMFFRGDVDFISAAAVERHRGGILLEWLPSPKLTVWARGAASEIALQSIMERDTVTMAPRTPTDHVPQQSTQTRSGRRSSRSRFETDTRLISHECGDRTAVLSHAVLHVINGQRMIGRLVTWPDGSVGPGRQLFQGGGWRVTVDEVQGASDLLQKLKRKEDSQSRTSLAWSASLLKRFRLPTSRS